MTALRNDLSEQAWNEISGRDDPEQRFRLYRLCECEVCGGTGGPVPEGGGVRSRCPGCRGEGRTLENVATTSTPEGVGTALVKLAQEGEFDECPIGVLDSEGETGRKWLVSPWLPSPRNVSDAGRVLRSAQTKGEQRGNLEPTGPEDDGDGHA
jgi:hypothetical protein